MPFGIIASLLLLGIAFSLAAQDEIPEIIRVEKRRCGEIIDMHLHVAPWVSDADDLLDELDKSGVDKGILYALYITTPLTTRPEYPDQNELVSNISLASRGRIFGFASLNTSIEDWSGAPRESELNRLTTFLDRPEFLGAKLAPTHACLPLDGERMADVVQAIDSSASPVVAIHTGTTPMCGPFGDFTGIEACCDREYVDPSLLAPLIETYPNTTFILLHSGHDFLPPNSDPRGHYYNGTLVDHSVELAVEYNNVLLEISAIYAEDQPWDLDNNFRHPGGDEVLQKIIDAGVVDKIIWGSDANHYKGAVVEIMKESFEGMVEAGMTDEQRCSALTGKANEIIFRMPAAAEGEQPDPENKKNTSSSSSSSPAIPSLLHNGPILNTGLASLIGILLLTL
eukprot:jgi/Psemu1/3132/gm1.3132_g